MKQLAAAIWLVWSNEHSGYWGPNHCGYYRDLKDAGRYTLAEANKIAETASPRAAGLVFDGIPPEVVVPSPEAVSMLERLGNLDLEGMEVVLRDYASAQVTGDLAPAGRYTVAFVTELADEISEVLLEEEG